MADDSTKLQDDGPVKLTTWVQGGTTSSEYDKQVQKLKFDAEKRRREHDAEQAIANRPLEAGGGNMYSANFTDVFDPRVLLQYVPAREEAKCEILCELVKDDVSGDYMLTLPCPECVGRGLPQDQAQFHIRKGNRRWDIDERERGEGKTYVEIDYWTGNPVKQVYVSAGVIMDTEAFRCPHAMCGVTYKIHKNKLYRVYRGN